MRGVLSLSELRTLADALGVDLDPRPVRMTNKPAPARSLQAVREIVAEYGGVSSTTDAIPAGRLTAGELRRRARAVGIPIGDERADNEDREWTAKHEAAHAAVAHSLGWKVTSVDVGAGQTRMSPPDDVHGAERDLGYAVIGAAASAFTGLHPDRDEFGSDRSHLRMSGAGHMSFEEARVRAMRLTNHEYVKPLYQRLTAALLKHGRLEGAELRRVLEGGNG